MKPQPLASLMPQTVLGIAAHPDDLDFGAGGSLAAFAAGGAAIHYLILTDGGKGSADPKLTFEQITEIRHAEQQAACQAVNGTAVHYLNHPDSELEASRELKLQLVRAIRTTRPDVVITTDPSYLYSMQYGIINHTDHRAAGEATIDAVYPLARDHLTFPELLSEGLAPHKVSTVLLINFDTRNYYVDISSTLQNKLAALSAHTSQFSDMAAVHEMVTNMATADGQAANCQYAEGFVRIDVTPN